MSCKPRIYFFNGEELTTKELSIKYNIPVDLVYKAFNCKNYPSFQEMLDWRKQHNINDISCYKYKDNNKDVLRYNYNGENLTASEISKKYKIPDRLVWKAFNDDSKPSLDEIIKWRKENGIFDTNDYRCPSSTKQIKIKNCKTNKIKNCKINKQNTIKKSNDSEQSLNTASSFGCYEIISKYKKNNTTYLTVQCCICNKLYYDIPLRSFINIIKNKECHCHLLSHFKIIKHLPLKLQRESLSETKKDISFYKSFIGFNLCGIKITGVIKKQSNDCDIFIFNCTCPKCNANFTVKAFNLITDNFKHKCDKQKIIKKYKNSSCLYAFCKQKKYKTNSYHIHRDISEDMIEMLKESIGFYTRKYGTEEFMNLCLDAELTGNKEHLKNMFFLEG